MKTVQQRIAERKAQLTAQAEISDNALNELAVAELAEQTAKTIDSYSDNIDNLLKASGVQRDWATKPKYEYGTSVGAAARFVTQWVYLPDALKTLTGLEIPVTAFNSNMLEAWGKLPYCNALGIVTEAAQPDLKSVGIQVEMVKHYLGLDFVEDVLTVEQWETKRQVALTKALKKQAEVETADIEDATDKALGKPTFTI